MNQSNILILSKSYSCTFPRCNESDEFKKYDELNTKLTYADENKILELTGCLSTCDKYEYFVEPMTDLTDRSTYDYESETEINRLTLKFYFTSGRHEVKEQVHLPSCHVTISVTVTNTLFLCSM